MAQFQLGSISTGTLKIDDLLEATATTLNNLGSTVTTDTHTWEYDDEMLLSIYMEALNELCPPLVYFGTPPGDGADFGFWPDMNRLDEELYNQTGAPHLDKVPSYCLPMHQDYPYGEIELKDDNVIVQLSDHGNVTVMDMERNVIWSVV